MYKQLSIEGFRGFADAQVLALAQPTGEPGSGLTVIVGANNAGKSTVIEAFRSFSPGVAPSFPFERRNIAAGDKVNLKLTETSGISYEIKSRRPGFSETDLTPDGVRAKGLFVLPSRRVFAPYFQKNEWTRETYTQHMQHVPLRANTLDAFASRLFAVAKTAESQNAFDALLAKVVAPVPTWSIDQNGNGQYFFKMLKAGASHTSEGLGEGLVSLLFIIDALYDSSAGDCIVIDEPELSLHPALQRKLSQLLAESSRDRQIVIATHSPYFVNLPALQAGATVARVYLSDDTSQIAQISVETSKKVGKILVDANNPHVFGLNAQETFFLEDHVILVEGQEDVVFYPRIEECMGIELGGTFFGWGVGGADKMKLISTVLNELGFKKVVGFLDGDKSSVRDQLQAEFPQYKFLCIPTADVRSKALRKEKAAVEGLLESSNKDVRPEHISATREIFEEAQRFLSG